jgi:hypothetical protein
MGSIDCARERYWVGPYGVGRRPVMPLTECLLGLLGGQVT